MYTYICIYVVAKITSSLCLSNEDELSKRFNPAKSRLLIAFGGVALSVTRRKMDFNLLAQPGGGERGSEREVAGASENLAAYGEGVEIRSSFTLFEQRARDGETK